MSTDISGLHHVGLVVRDLGRAVDIYRQLGFSVDPPSVPVVMEEGGTGKPCGAANTHAYFSRSFVELMAVVTESTSIPSDARQVPVQVPPSHLPQVMKMIEATVGDLGSRVARFEGLHRLVFASQNADAVAERLTGAGVPNTGVNTTQRPIETDQGTQVETIRHLEISALPDGSPVPEAVLAVAELETMHAVHVKLHANGVTQLVEAVLCAPDGDLASLESRYSAYLDVEPRAQGRTRVFELPEGTLTLVRGEDLGELIPGETAPDGSPALVAFTVASPDVQSTEAYLKSQGFGIYHDADGRPFVPGSQAAGAAMILSAER